LIFISDFANLNFISLKIWGEYGGVGSWELVSNPFTNIQIIFSNYFQFPFLAPQAPQAPHFYFILYI